MEFDWIFRSVLLLLIVTWISGSKHQEFDLKVVSSHNNPEEWGFRVDQYVGGKEPAEEDTSLKVRRMTFHHDKENISISLGGTIVCKDSAIPSDYEYFEGLGYYKFHTVPVKWLEAHTKCSKEGGHLLIINSLSEVNVIRTFYTRKPIIPGADYSDYYHVGFHDMYEDGKFVTVTGEDLSCTGYVKWENGQPGEPRDEMCGCASSKGELCDTLCRYIMPYICEYPVPS